MKRAQMIGRTNFCRDDKSPRCHRLTSSRLKCRKFIMIFRTFYFLRSIWRPSCSTTHSPSTSQSNSVLSLSPSKQTPSVFSRYEESFSEENSPLDDDYVFSDFKTLAAKDEKLRELIPQVEALKRVKRFMKTFLQKKAERIRRGEDEDSTDSEGEEDIETEVPLVLAPFFTGKGEMTRLESTVRKKMAAVHFTTIPCESNAANMHIESHIFLRNCFLY